MNAIIKKQEKNKSGEGKHKTLFVDLDGTLLQTDTIFELIFRLLKKNIFLFLKAPFWLLKGRVHFKKNLSLHVNLNPKTLPFNHLLLEYLKSEKEAGRRIVLATGSFHEEARLIADHLKLFDDVLSSDSRTNLIGKNKANAILEYQKGKPFAYAGNSFIDKEIWRNCDEVITVNTHRILRSHIQKHFLIARDFSKPTTTFSALIKALRPHQWIKNALLFLPMIAAHKVSDLSLWFTASLGFFAFCLCASSVYIINDLIDLDHDRQHPNKKNRPFASGQLPLWFGIFVSPWLLIASFATAFLIDVSFASLLFGYFLLTWSYSYRLKKAAILDVLILAVLYSMRIFSGSLLTDITISPWLLAFSCFFFFSLALTKRSTELKFQEGQKDSLKSGRGYIMEDLSMINQMGISSGLIATLIFALYINTPDHKALYSNPEFLWIAFISLFYWINRIWLITNRGQMHHDPVVFALKDPMSYLIVFFIAASLALASF